MADPIDMGDHTLTPVDHDPFAGLSPSQVAAGRDYLAAERQHGLLADPHASVIDPMRDVDPVARGASLQTYTPSFSERVGATVQDAAEGLGYGRGWAQGAGDLAKGAAGLTPMSAGYDAGRAAAGGEYGRAALDAFGALPGGVASGLAHGAAAVGAAGLGKLAIFAGPMARTADKAALETAQKMAAEGASRDDIWKNTGWFTGRDGQWRFEIPDNAAKLDVAGIKAGMDEPVVEGEPPPKVRDYFSHDPLYAAYPQAGDYRIGVVPRGRPMNGMFDPEAGTVDLRMRDEGPMTSTALHELQHGVQNIEGFGGGYNPAMATDDVAQARYALTGLNQTKTRLVDEAGDRARILLSQASQGDPVARQFADAAHQKWREQLGDVSDDNPFGIDRHQAVQYELLENDPIYQHAVQMHNNAWRMAGLEPEQVYRRTSGEVEARNVQTRANMTPDERRAKPPWVTQDTPDELQFVRNGSNVLQADASPPASLGADFNAAPKAFPEGRISTTVPWAKSVGDAAHKSSDYRIGYDTSVASPKAFEKNAELIRDYPGIRLGRNPSPAAAHEALINHVKTNLLALHDIVPEDIRAGSQRWYDGANRLANDWAAEYGITPQQASGALAALSPQRDWDMNVALSRRVLDTLHNEASSTMTPEMAGSMRNLISMQKVPSVQARLQAAHDRMLKTPLSELEDPVDKAMWIRAYDEAHGAHSPVIDDAGQAHPTAFRILNPDGTFGAIKMTKAGGPAKAGWGTVDQIANAVRAAQAPDMSTISDAMGGNHKVRNFYNNIVAPNSKKGDVTIDTHAIAAGLLRPLGGSAPEVEHGLGLSGSADASTGSKGLYGAYAEGYRQAAAERGILPRQMQSITWEALRGLFSPAQKGSKEFRAGVDALWKLHGAKKAHINDIHAKLMRDAQGNSVIRPPRWYSGASDFDEE